MLKHRLVVLIVLGVLLSGCAAGRAFRKGQEAERVGDFDTAVAEFTRAVQEDPTRAEFRISLERATQNASREHIVKAHELELNDQLDAALLEYKRAVELDATNRLAASRAAELEKTIRDRIEASRPRPAIEKMREDARAQAMPLLNPASRQPIKLNFNNASLRDILNFLGTQSGINITYDPLWRDKAYTVSLDGVTLEEALQQILSANQAFYKVANPKTILVADDTPAMHQKYDEMVIRVFYISHADVAELAQTLNTVMRLSTMPVQPTLLPSKTSNTITVRATAQVMDVIERVIRANDKPRAEVIIDVQILEVNRKRTKQLGLNLNSYSLGLTFSPEAAPPNTGGGGGEIGTTNPPPFNLNTISQGISTNDFYLSVPAAIVRFLEQDSHTKLIAKPQLRGAEGTKLTLNLGDQIPVLSTVFGVAAAGGVASVPQSSFNYKDVGVNIEMTPRVTYEGDIVLDGFSVESSALGPDISVAGQSVPSFSSRKVTTKLRLREGESTLLAGLLRDEQRKILTGFPGVMRVPILRSLFGSSNDEVNQSDIVMLLTPHIVRTHELTTEDLAPIYIGTQAEHRPRRTAAPHRAAARGAAGGERADGRDTRAGRRNGQPAGGRAADQSAGAAGHLARADAHQPGADDAAGHRDAARDDTAGHDAARDDSGARRDDPAARRAGSHSAGNAGAGDRHAARHRVPDRGRALHRACLDQQRLAGLVADAHGDL